MNETIFKYPKKPYETEEKEKNWKPQRETIQYVFGKEMFVFCLVLYNKNYLRLEFAKFSLPQERVKFTYNCLMV